MIVTAATPKYEGMTVADGGCLLTDADVLDIDGRGALVSHKAGQHSLTGQPMVMLEADSLAHPSKTLYFDLETAEHLANVILAQVRRARERTTCPVCYETGTCNPGVLGPIENGRHVS